MAEIHIGKISQTDVGKGKAQLIYHIPIDTPKASIVPTPESSIADQLEPAEIAALAAGTLVEIAKDIVVLGSQTQAEIVTAIRANWQDVKAVYNSRYNFEHKFHGITLSAQ